MGILHRRDIAGKPEVPQLRSVPGASGPERGRGRWSGPAGDDYLHGPMPEDSLTGRTDAAEVALEVALNEGVGSIGYGAGDGNETIQFAALSLIYHHPFILEHRLENA